MGGDRARRGAASESLAVGGGAVLHPDRLVLLGRRLALLVLLACVRSRRANRGRGHRGATAETALAGRTYLPRVGEHALERAGVDLRLRRARNVDVRHGGVDLVLGGVQRQRDAVVTVRYPVALRRLEHVDGRENREAVLRGSQPLPATPPVVAPERR